MSRDADRALTVALPIIGAASGVLTSLCFCNFTGLDNEGNPMPDLAAHNLAIYACLFICVAAPVALILTRKPKKARPEPVQLTTWALAEPEPASKAHPADDGEDVVTEAIEGYVPTVRHINGSVL